MLISAIIAVSLYRYHSALWPMSWWGIGSLRTRGGLCRGLDRDGSPLSSIASLLVSAVLLPLVPFHDGHLTALTRLPGSLPSFVVMLLPLAGLHELATVLPAVPDVVAWTVSFFALAGALLRCHKGAGANPRAAPARLRQLLVLLDVLVVCRGHGIGNAPIGAVGRHGRPCGQADF